MSRLLRGVAITHPVLHAVKFQACHSLEFTYLPFLGNTKFQKCHEALLSAVLE